MRAARLLTCASIVACAVVLAVQSRAEAASRVLEMDRQGRVHERIDRALPADAGWPVEALAPDAAPPGRAAMARTAAADSAVRGGHARASRVRARSSSLPRGAGRAVRRPLKRLLAQGRVERAAYVRYRRMFDRAVRTARGLSGTRRSELHGAIANVYGITARGGLIAERLPALFATLERNRQWWRTGRLLSYGERVAFSDSELVWQHYPGEGIQLQVLGTFGKANGLWMARDDAKLRALLDEMVALAARRGSALAWEYYFDFGGGSPPWTSGMSQATGIQALSRASQRLDEPAYLDVAQRALRLFRLPTPTGVRVATDVGARYVIYSYAPTMAVANAFVQTLVGLHDYAEIADDRAARRLYRAGDRQARLDVRASDTGAWSLYQVGGRESDLGYHTLLRDFLRNLCDRVETAVYCETATSFSDYLKEPPELTLVTRRVRVRRQAIVRFDVSKVSRVGMTIRRDGETLLSTSASLSRGRHGYTWRVPATPGVYDVTLTGTDLAGNFGRSTHTIRVLGPAPRV